VAEPGGAFATVAVEVIVSERASAAGLKVSSKVAMAITDDWGNQDMRMRTGSAVASRCCSSSQTKGGLIVCAHDVFGSL